MSDRPKTASGITHKCKSPERARNDARPTRHCYLHTSWLSASLPIPALPLGLIYCRRPCMHSRSSERISLCILQSCFDFRFQLRLRLVEALGLILVELPEGQHFHNAALAEYHFLCEIRQIRDVGFAICAFCALPPTQSSKDSLAEPRTCVSH